MILAKRHSFSLIFLGLLFSFAAMSQTPLDIELNKLLSNSVPLLHENELAQMLAKKKITLLDTRSKAEYDVSHIEGAKFIDYDSFTPEMVSGLNKNKPVVVYCSVGYRSEKIGEKLQKQGFKNVQNLYGGIFEWKNNGHTVVDTMNVPTDSVHTYNADWGRFLTKGIKVVE